jgi:Zn-dependent peptidase ImmA (M78 family)/transcriptional regulator with XRE-family HTH domain
VENKFNPAMVTLARDSRGLTQTELADRIRVPQGTISKVESGALSISDDLAAKLSKELEYPEGFFAQTDIVFPFGSSTFYHRKLQSVPAAVLRKIEAKVNIYRFHVTRLIRATDLDTRLRFRRVDAKEHKGNIEEIAQLTRAAWNLPTGPIDNLVHAIENAGGIVIRFSFETRKMFGLSEWIPPAPPLFFLNDHPEISADRDRFTLAHELGHVLLHHLPNPAMEKESDRFAAEFLMPQKDIRSHFKAPVKLHTVARLKPYWKVSMAALVYRAHELRVINDNQHTYLRIQLQGKGYRYREPAELDFPKEQPSLLPEIIQAHVKELGFGYPDIAEMTGMNVAEFKAYHRVDSGAGLKIVSSSN